MQYQLPFSEDLKDQIRLSEAGGYISINANGAVFFKFDSRKAYQEYLRGSNHETTQTAHAHA